MVMVLELAWNPRWVTIISVNCSARSTLLISKAPAMILPFPAIPDSPMLASPELLDTTDIVPDYVLQRLDDLLPQADQRGDQRHLGDRED